MMIESKGLIKTQSKAITKNQQTSCSVSISREKQRIFNEYGTFENVLMSFSPSSQTGSKMSIGNAFKSNAPTLTYLDLCYGEGSAITWLVAWVSYIYGICGFVNNEVTDNTKISTVNAIMDEYYFLNLNELITFFKMFIAGKFEKFYKKPNPQVITKSLYTFCSQRMDAVKAVEANIKKENEAKEDEAIRQNAIPYEEWAAIKKAKGEEVNIELIEDDKGNKLYRVKAPKADARLDSAYMIVKNTTNADFKAICKLRECFVKKYGIDPYDLIRSLGNKKLREYEERRNCQGNH
nr:MAG TPA: hypothetical protein [Caudoviricetes sp.]